MELWQQVCLVAYCSIVAVLGIYGLHRYLLLRLFQRHRGETVAPSARFAHLPSVTIQLPLYNEYHVVERLLDTVAQIDYPRDRLQIQVLDDSTDATSDRARQRCEQLRADGLDIDYLHRTHRTGFKAGALAAGLASATGEFVLILDADFVPPSDLLHSTIHYFTDPRVGMVQTRWGHLNREHSLLTRIQSIFLDGHFVIEHTARSRSGRFFNFNGTCGVWRKTAIVDAGGWQHDTLTEDLDLSYRAQLAGWRFAYLDDVVVPAEVPATVSALEVQQRRWAQGGVQTGRKVLPRLLRTRVPAPVKFEAVVHLFGHLAHPLTWALAILLFPSAVARRELALDHLLGLDLMLFATATLPFVVFYWSAGEIRGRPRKGRVGESCARLLSGSAYPFRSRARHYAVCAG